MSDKEIIKEFAFWIRRHLENGTVARKTQVSYDEKKASNAYAVVEIPDWEMRQKLELAEENYPPETK